MFSLYIIRQNSIVFEHCIYLLTYLQLLSTKNKTVLVENLIIPLFSLVLRNSIKELHKDYSITLSTQHFPSFFMFNLMLLSQSALFR